MNRPIPLWLILALALPLVGCPTTAHDHDDDDDDLADDDDSAGDDDTGDDDDTSSFPASPLPFTLQLAGGLDEAVTIDTFGSCQNYSGSSDIRQQWVGSGSWALRVQISGTYTGAGEYDETTGVLVTLQRNVANGEFFQAGANTAHTAALTMEGDDGTNAWGSVTIDGMTDTAAAGGTVTVTPPTIPIWCETIQH